MLREIYAPFNLPIVSVSRRSAEMIKYASNDFLALKLSYMNDIANLCELVGADIEDVARGMSFDERIGSRFLGAGIGYGGSCFRNCFRRGSGCRFCTAAQQQTQQNREKKLHGYCLLARV